jgi:predicted secreted protein
VAFVDTAIIRDPSKPVMPGSGATRCLRFRAVQPGLATITLNYQRPWESVPPIRQIVLTIWVR